jgi:hypothetical protein
MTKFKKGLLVLAAVFILTILASPKVYAALSGPTTVKAYRGIQIFYNGQQLNLIDSSQPYVINNTTFIPLRALMNYFGKTIVWDGTNNRILITDETLSLKEQLAQKDAQIKSLQNQITQLNSKINDSDLDDIEDTLRDYFEDAGDDYFDDNGIEISLSLDGDEDDISYDIELDFDDADDYDDLTDLSQSDIRRFLNAVRSKIISEIEDTDYEDAEISGELSDNDYSRYYVRYSRGNYRYSWNDTDLSDIEDVLNDYFDEDTLNDYFDDTGIDITLSLDGDDEDLEYTIEIDFSDSDEYNNLDDVNKSDIEDFLDAFKSKLSREIKDTYYEDADITGELIDNDDSDYHVDYSNGRYRYSW